MRAQVGATTDRVGRFELRDVPRRDVMVEVRPRRAYAFRPRRVSVDSLGSGNVRIAVERWVCLRLKSAAASVGLKFELHSATGERLVTRKFYANQNVSSMRLPVDGPEHAPLIGVSSAAVSVVLYRDGAEVSHVAIPRSADEVQVVRLP